MFERFTVDARQAVLQCARLEARSLGDDYLGTQHLLLGLLEVRQGLACRALESLDVTPERVRSVATELRPPAEELHGKLFATADALKALECSLRAALLDDHSDVDTEHVLLGLLAGGDGLTLTILRELNSDAHAVRAALTQLMAER